MRTYASILTLLLVALGTSGCGYKGPLVLPESAATSTVPAHLLLATLAPSAPGTLA
ncbi:LPS translocon maturation chaperone LptM [Paenalcaligenes niemegkensis]|uniref:LPS translocon maturation chaperone LptM n=1 Tax=Paenalcaligenes niemegkensis TaxID=2895469 RepID=UPI00356710B6